MTETDPGESGSPAAPGTATPPPPAVSVAPGWYAVSSDRTAQSYWDGTTWTKTRRWRGTGWLEDSVSAAPEMSWPDAPPDLGDAPPSAPPGPPGPSSRWLAPGTYPRAGYGHYAPMQPSRPVATTTNGFAIASLVCSIVSLFGIGSLLGIIFGYKARREIRESRGYQTGDGLALAGIIIGFVTLAMAIVVVALWVSLFLSVRSAINNPNDSTFVGTQQTVASCTADVKTVEVALLAAKAQNSTSTYPAPPAQWSASTYVSNYTVLTAPAGGQRFLVAAPPTTNYVVEFDAQGNVWVAPAGTYETTFEPQQSLGTNPAACDVAVG